jgi:hypothetical protein
MGRQNDWSESSQTRKKPTTGNFETKKRFPCKKTREMNNGYKKKGTSEEESGVISTCQPDHFYESHFSLSI